MRPETGFDKKGKNTLQLNSHLHFSGQCEEAFKFYEKCLGGKIEGLFRYEGAPGGEAQKVSPEWRNKIMHTCMTIGDQVLMGMDAPPERFQKPQGFHVNIAVKDVAEGKKIFPGTIRKRKRSSCPSAQHSGHRGSPCSSIVGMVNSEQAA
jgi:uncharacterized glyoxalase superfamily protein PhnB